MYAVLYGDAQTVRQLLDAGADPNVADLAGTTPLMLAVTDIDKTTLLLGRGADISAKDREGRTLLMLAAASAASTADVVRFLIARGADVNATTPSGHSALGYARRHGDTPVVRMLLAAGARDVALPPAPADVSPAASPRAAVTRSLPLLQKADVEFMSKSGCVSCHHNTLTALSVAAARQRGMRIDETLARRQVTAIGRYLESWRERALQGIGIPGDADTTSYIFLGLAAEKYPADAATDAMVRFLKGQQRPEGHWLPLALRPPIEASVITATALTVRALHVYAPPVERPSYDLSIRRAAAWLAAAKPLDTEDRAVLLLGLTWSGAKRAALDAAARSLIAEQRSDGGWAQIPSLTSDAYATGQALYALAESGAVTTSHPAFARGVEFLLKTQLADGSWFVCTRAIPLQPHFESGFPHGRDQFISAAATNWATLALTHAARAGS